MNKIIFLDIDGVLVTLNHFKTLKGISESRVNIFEATQCREDGRDVIVSVMDPNCIEILNKVLNAIPNANIVISSTWRMGRNIEELRAILNHFGIDGSRVISKTRNISSIRGEEIEEWLNTHEWSSFVILDDDSDMLEHQLKNFVKTSFEKGLEEKHVEQIFTILNNE